MALAGWCLALVPAAATEVGLAGILGQNALLVIDGGPARKVAPGERIGQVRLLSVQDGRVVVDIAGQQRSLSVGQHAVGRAADGANASVVLRADSRGHFVSTGEINGVSVRFLVDTGASMISLGAADARRVGLDLARGTRGVSMTANGQAEVLRLKLDRVRLGDITLYNVDALVHQTDLPVALLGMSFLNRMEMQRDGSTMILKKRY